MGQRRLAVACRRLHRRLLAHRHQAAVSRQQRPPGGSASAEIVTRPAMLTRFSRHGTASGNRASCTGVLTTVRWPPPLSTRRAPARSRHPRPARTGRDVHTGARSSPSRRPGKAWPDDWRNPGRSAAWRWHRCRVIIHGEPGPLQRGRALTMCTSEWIRARHREGGHQNLSSIRAPGGIIAGSGPAPLAPSPRSGV
jgi:hypothetical protein